ncbi:hypothetical protein [Paraliobacillus ryukyuensis]|uniref:hypothetical protein n=1 Tax=Paraliobacillus ryukyuensis TaxID=200904 RepID=UPI0009A7F7CF|nr:hypothetical protein [Paraliobacillus ryukyuensis]
MYNIELNNAQKHLDTKIKQNSPAIEIFSALVKGDDTSKFGKNTDKVVGHLKDLGERAFKGDFAAKSELNAFVKFTIMPRLQERINLFEFMGRFSRIGYADAAYIEKYKHNTRSNRQASQGDVSLSTMEKVTEPLGTHTISGGFEVNYRELASGNLTRISEGMDQVKVDIYNKAMHYVMATLYNEIKNTSGIKYFAEASGINKAAVDENLRKVRRNGKPSILGDYSVVSQLNGFQGYADGAPNAYSDQALEEIRQTGLLGMYGGSPVMEIPNQYNFSKLNAAGDNYQTQLPEGLLYLVPQGNNGVYPLQIVQRGDLQSATGMDITTGTEITRFDLEIGAGVANPDAIGLISDTDFDAPTE